MPSLWREIEAQRHRGIPQLVAITVVSNPIHKSIHNLQPEAQGANTPSPGQSRGSGKPPAAEV